MEENAVIKVEHLCKTYKIFDTPVDRLKESLNPFHKRYSRDFYALQDVSFEVKKGENVGIIGKNGAGKSTLLKIITGVLTPSNGVVRVNGKIASLLELGAGFNPDLTGVENVYLNGTIMGYSRDEMSAKLMDIVEFADIGDFINQPVKTYSSGMFARLAFAVNAFVEPDILIVDEALSVGDRNFQVKCMQKMRDLIDGGTSVLFVSHDINAIRRFCDRAFWMDHGVLKLEGDVNWVADRYMEFVKQGSKEQKRKKKKVNKKVNNTIAEIERFNVLDSSGTIVEQVPYNQPISVEVFYRVIDDSIQEPVLGVAVRSIDDDYICGINTLLDHKKIPWKLGINRMCLHYPQGLRALGGTYYFDVALFEATATIPIQYISRVREIVILPDYKGEGVFIIPHKWHEGGLEDHGEV